MMASPLMTAAIKSKKIPHLIVERRRVVFVGGGSSGNPCRHENIYQFHLGFGALLLASMLLLEPLLMLMVEVGGGPIWLRSVRVA
jgi:hypothetical protein